MKAQAVEAARQTEKQCRFFSPFLILFLCGRQKRRKIAMPKVKPNKKITNSTFFSYSINIKLSIPAQVSIPPYANKVYRSLPLKR